MVGSLNQVRHINSNNTFNICSAPAILKGVNINSVGSSWNIKIYDDADGTNNLIADITPNYTGMLDFNTKLNDGLTVVTSGSSAGSATLKFEGE